MFIMLNKIKLDLLNLGLKFISIDEKIVRMFLETKPSNTNKIVILPAVNFVMKKILNKLQNKSVHGRVCNGRLNGVNVSVISSLVGSPNCAITVESLKRCNVKAIIRVDLCGGIENDSDQPQIKIGDILIPKNVYCGDGTSPSYISNNSEILPQMKYASNPMSKMLDIKSINENVFITQPNDELKKIILQEGSEYKIKEANLWTTDALFCETQEFIDSLKSINVQGVDMESSILFLLGNIYKIKTASVLSVSDLPGNSKYDLFKSNELHPNMELGIDNAIKVVSKALPKINSILN